MSAPRKPPTDDEIAEMRRILLKVEAHEMPSADEITFLHELKIEVLERYIGPSMRVDPPDSYEPA